MDGCIYRSQFDLCEKSKEEDEKRGIRRWCDFERCEDKHPSNADRIRGMLDEELAEILHSLKNKCGDCPVAKSNIFCSTFPTCKDAWLAWLRQEAKHGCTD